MYIRNICCHVSYKNNHRILIHQYYLINNIKNFLDIKPELTGKIADYYRRFYAGHSILAMISKHYMEQGLRELGLYPEPPSKPIRYSEYTYFADMARGLARMVSIFWSQKQIGPPPRATRNSGRPIRNQQGDDSSSEEETPTQKTNRLVKAKKQSPRENTSKR